MVRRSRLKPLRKTMRNVERRAIVIGRVTGAPSMAAEQPGQLQPLNRGYLNLINST